MSLNCAFAGDPKVTRYKSGKSWLFATPQDTEFFSIRNWPAPVLIGEICQTLNKAIKLSLLVVSFTSITSITAQAQSGSDENGPLPDVVIHSLLNEPVVGRSAALSCQAIFRLGQEKAESKVQLSGTLEGEREILSNLRGPLSPDEPNSISRSYNRDLADIFDAEIEARYRLYDWGVSDNRIQAEELRLEEARLDVDIKLAERSHDLVQRLISYQYAIVRVEQLTKTLSDIAPHIASMEAQSEAGSIAVAELRSAKLAELDVEIKLQRAETELAENIKNLKNQFGLTFQEAKPLLEQFISSRPTLLPELEARQWTRIASQNLRIRAEQFELNALEHAQRTVMDYILSPIQRATEVAFREK